MPDSISNKAAITGIGQTVYARGMNRSDASLAMEAIANAIKDAGLTTKDIDGISRYDIDTNVEQDIVHTLGLNDPGFFATMPSGGGSFCGVITMAAMAVATGQAKHVVCFRALNWSSAGNTPGLNRIRMASNGPNVITGASQWHVPFGLGSPAHEMAMIGRRLMHDYGWTEADFGSIAVTMRKHAVTNPAAMMRKPMTLEDHRNSRWVCEPMHLLDCCLVNDGAAAVIVSSAERAVDMPNPPAYILGAAQAVLPHHGRLTDWWKYHRDRRGHEIGERVFASAGVKPADIDVALIFDHFTPMVPVALEDLGFCKRGEGADFIKGGRIEWPNGPLPVNPHGGQLSEAFIHGMNNITEAVRQVRGSAANQVKDCELAVVLAANTDPTGAIILRR